MQDKILLLSSGLEDDTQKTNAETPHHEVPEQVLSNRLRQALPRLSRIVQHAALLGPTIVGAGTLSSNSWGQGVGC